MNRLILVVLCAVVAGLAMAPAGGAEPVSSSAYCDTIRFAGVPYVFYREEIGCRYAKHLARKVRRSKLRRPARNWRCTSGSGFTTGANCRHRDGRLFGWHPFD